MTGLASKYSLYGDDDESYDPWKPRERPPWEGWGEAHTSPEPVTRQSTLIEVECGLDRLPTAVTLKRAWKDSFAPSQYGQSIMDAYHYAVQELAARLIESGTIPPATIPILREVTPLLLRTRTYEEYLKLYDELFTQKPHTVHGPGYNQYDEPGITVVATRSRLISVAVDPDWAARTDQKYISQDIVVCCAQIRARKPEKVKDIFLDQESDRELAARIVRHEKYLQENEI
ncbi:hypothetical protein [Nocardia jinanensis]|uniref:Uncharacterized protein n=1 Tax=Nocardia jinanensis TaxID=382504 RepID=A0A917VVI7_9NOCA|nr:hypothetical protein [Nocardia jinanensis]GGL18498.1 hypothetical protein GCM10011588_36390 [Nocardia jinanensis]